MKIEEAGELVLGGKPWVRCVNCRGTGRLSLVDGYPTESDLKIDCGRCSGKGFWLSNKAKEAYEMLDLEVPPRPMTPRERLAATLGGTIREGLNRQSAVHDLVECLGPKIEEDK